MTDSESSGSIRVLIADDNPVIIEGLKALLGHADDIDVVGDAPDGREAIEQTYRLRPDIVLLDVRMPVLDGISAAEEISRHAKVLMLSYAEDAQVVAAAVRKGAVGYLVHGAFDLWELSSSIRAVQGGQSVLSPRVTAAVMDALRGSTPDVDESAPHLTARETQLMELMTEGLTNSVIAQRMFVAEKTVKNHINRIYAKLGVGNRSEAVAYWTAETLLRRAE